ncbi:putative phosphoglycerate mutase pmu1 [Recurvomyces mirabilis]|nr:putative phosphoglycerate mutase pmu1 [Recurvomyces mirabilis]
MAKAQETFSDFTYVPGIFSHDQQQTGPDSGFRAKTLPRLGILDREYPSGDASNDDAQWQRLHQHLQRLNRIDPQHERYKVLYVARHGEGVHNVKEREVGRHEWERHWSKLEGDGNVTWLNPSLTEKGFEQARELGVFWRNTIDHDHVPPPESLYTSPLWRGLQTTDATWSNVLDLGRSRPVVTEELREVYGVHTCDKRGSASATTEHFPDFVLAPGLSEEDELWTPDRRETLDEHADLWRTFLQYLFDTDTSTFVSITTHSGATRALYAAIGHPDVWLAAGSVVPIMVRGRTPDST